jgi:hypothetical protein
MAEQYAANHAYVAVRTVVLSGEQRAAHPGVNLLDVSDFDSPDLRLHF